LLKKKRINAGRMPASEIRFFEKGENQAILQQEITNPFDVHYRSNMAIIFLPTCLNISPFHHQCAKVSEA